MPEAGEKPRTDRARQRTANIGAWINITFGGALLVVGRAATWGASLLHGLWAWPLSVFACMFVVLGGAGLGLGLLYIVSGRSFDEGDSSLPLWWKLLAAVVAIGSMLAAGVLLGVL